MSELRRDPILRRWVIIAPDRLGDLSEGRQPQPAPETSCPFCPGNEHRNPEEILTVKGAAGWAIRITPDKHPLLRIEGDLGQRGAGMCDVMNAIGAHELVTDTPSHDETWADFSSAHMTRLLEAYRTRIVDLRRDSRFRFVVVMKNHGAVWSRYRHAHSHVVATPFTPKRIEEESAGAREYFRMKERCVFCDQAAEERRARARVVGENEHAIAFAPFASEHPYELRILPNVHAADFGAAPDRVLPAVADLLSQCLGQLGRVLGNPGYSVALHTGALAGTDHAEFHWHWEIAPHLRHERGMEWATGIYSNPVPPEDAAAALRAALT